jgi:Flp pilus assembly protein CpaB
MSTGTLFAIAVAILVGLIFAWLFREVVWKRPTVQKPVEETYEVTVAAANIYPEMEIKALQVKTKRVSKQQRDIWLKSGKTMLYGSQPVGRVSTKAVLAEEPFYAEDLYPLTYPEPVWKKLAPGMRAVVVTVPAKEAMVQVNDYVDVYCTLSSDALGTAVGGNGTAEIAKGTKVVARFGTTKPGAQPRDPSAPREYTLEVTPYRYALIELAKTAGGKFSLAVAPVGADGERAVAPVGNDINDPRERSAELVGPRDLLALYGIGEQQGATPAWVVEKYVGIQPAGSASYPGYVPPSRSGGNGSTQQTPQATPAAGPGPQGSTRSERALPVANSPAPRVVTAPPPPLVRTLPPSAPTARATFTPGAAVASSVRSFGMGPPRDPSTVNCPT